MGVNPAMMLFLRHAQHLADANALVDWEISTRFEASRVPDSCLFQGVGSAAEHQHPLAKADTEDSNKAFVKHFVKRNKRANKLKGCERCRI